MGISISNMRNNAKISGLKINPKHSLKNGPQAETLSTINFDVPLTQQMTSNIAPSGVVSTNSVWSSTYAAWKAFDNDTSSYWASSSSTVYPVWLQYEFPNEVEVTSIYMKSVDNEHRPEDYEIQGSIDGTNWTTLLSITGEVYSGTEVSHNLTTTGIFKYYRIYITKDNIGGRIEISTLDFIGDITYSLNTIYFENGKINLPITGNFDYSGVASASSLYNGSFPASEAFNKVTDHYMACWASASDLMPQWLQYQFNTPQTIDSITIYPQNNIPNPTSTARDFEFQGSNDGTNWDTLLTVTGATYVAYESNYYDLTTTGSYTYYRLYITGSNHNHTTVGELIMHSKI